MGSEYVFRDPGFPLFKAGDSGSKVSMGGGMPQITIEITGLDENLGRDEGNSAMVDQGRLYLLWREL